MESSASALRDIDRDRPWDAVKAANAARITEILDEFGWRGWSLLELPCALDTLTDSNVAVYERRGYRVVADAQVTGSLNIRSMRRPISDLGLGDHP